MILRSPSYLGVYNLGDKKATRNSMTSCAAQNHEDKLCDHNPFAMTAQSLLAWHRHPSHFALLWAFHFSLSHLKRRHTNFVIFLQKMGALCDQCSLTQLVSEWMVPLQWWQELKSMVSSLSKDTQSSPHDTLAGSFRKHVWLIIGWQGVHMKHDFLGCVCAVIWTAWPTWC